MTRTGFDTMPEAKEQCMIDARRDFGVLVDATWAAHKLLWQAVDQRYS